MQNYESEMKALLQTLSESNALPYCIVTGSWAMFL